APQQPSHGLQIDETHELSAATTRTARRLTGTGMTSKLSSNRLSAPRFHHSIVLSLRTRRGLSPGKGDGYARRLPRPAASRADRNPSARHADPRQAVRAEPGLKRRAVDLAAVEHALDLRIIEQAAEILAVQHPVELLAVEHAIELPAIQHAVEIQPLGAADAT